MVVAPLQERPDGEALEQAIVAQAVELLSGPGRLISYVRRGMVAGRLGGPSIPLDVGPADTSSKHTSTRVGRVSSTSPSRRTAPSSRAGRCGLSDWMLGPRGLEPSTSPRGRIYHTSRYVMHT